MKKFFSTVIFLFISANFLHAADTPWKHFTKQNSQIPSDSINAITLDKSGKAWVATTGGIATYHNDQWQKFSSSDPNFEYIEGGITSMATNRDGETIWLGTPLGLARITDGELIMHGEGTALPVAYVTGVAVDSSNNVWAAMYTQGIVKFDGQNSVTYAGPDDKFKNASVVKFAASKDGKIFATMYGIGAAMFDGTAWTMLDSSVTGFQMIMPMDITASPNGDIWIGTLHGLAYRSASGSWNLMLPGETNLPSYVIMSVAADRSGKLWLGDGLASYDGTDFRKDAALTAWLSEKESYLRSITVADNGTVYAIVYPEGLLEYDPETATDVRENFSFDGIDVVEKDGKIFLSSVEQNDLSVEIFSLLGERIFSSEKNYSTGENVIDLSERNFSSGVYMISVNSGKNRYTKKIFLQ